jgi:hypothetical protein
MRSSLVVVINLENVKNILTVSKKNNILTYKFNKIKAVMERKIFDALIVESKH